MWSGFSFNREFTYSKRWFKKEWIVYLEDEDQWNTNDGRGVSRSRTREMIRFTNEEDAIEFVDYATIIDEEENHNKLSELIKSVQMEIEDNKRFNFSK